MGPQRYEPVPQRDDPIILDSINSYDYNSGLSDSIATPNSPPPSFHSSQTIHSSPGTPRPFESSTGMTTGASRSNDPSLELKLLRIRVDHLEESLGRVLLEQEKNRTNHGSRGSNCCVKISGANDLERMHSRGCCVSFSDPSDERSQIARKEACMLVFLAFFVLVVSASVVLNSYVKGRAAGCGPCKQD